MRLKTIAFAILILTGLSWADDKDGEWSGSVHARPVDKKDQTVKPYIRVDGAIKVLTGPNVAKLEECKKDRVWVVKGKLSGDGKSIEVQEMKERMEWTGEVKVANIGENKTPVAMLNHKDGYAMELKGKVASMDECKKKDWWKVKGRQSDDLKSVEVTEMTKIPKPEEKKTPKAEKEKEKK